MKDVFKAIGSVNICGSVASVTADVYIDPETEKEMFIAAIPGAGLCITDNVSTIIGNCSEHPD